MVVVRGMTLIFPLALIPIQLQLLGIAGYGEYNVLFAISAIGAVVINYGFDYSASRSISRSVNQLKEVSNIVSSAFYCKLINYCIVMLILFFYYLYNQQLQKFIIVAIFLFSQVLMPIYLFQGMKRMGYLIFNTFFLNVSFTAMLLLYLVLNISVSSDFAFLTYSIINILAAVQMVIFIRKRFYISLNKASRYDIFSHYKDGGWIFLSRMMSTGLSQWSILILSTLLSPALLGIYTLADKLVRASNSFFYAIQQATYPYFCNRENKKIFIKMTFSLVMLAFFCVAIVYLLQDVVAVFFPILKHNITPMLIMFSAIIPMSMSGMFGVNYLLANDYNKEFALVLALAAVFNMTMLKFYVHHDSIEDAAFILLSTEWLVTLLMILIILNKVRKHAH